MRQKSILILSAFLLITGTGYAQQKKTTKPKPKTTKAPVKKATPAAAAEPREQICYPLKEVKDYYKIDIRDKNFKSDFEEIFELSPYDYSGYSLKSIIENTIRRKLGDAAANSLDLFAGANYLEIGFIKTDYKKQIIEELCALFQDHDKFEKYIHTLKKKK